MNPSSSGPRQDPDSRPDTVDTVQEGVRHVVAEVMGLSTDSVSVRSDLIELGADSLQFVVIAAELEELFDISLPRGWAIPGRCSVADLARAVRSASSAAS